MVSADLFRALVLGVFGIVVLTHHATLAALIVTVMLVGTAQCFFDASAQGVIPAIVGRDTTTLARANGRFWALDTVGRSLLGPPAGSGSFALNSALPFVGDAVTFVGSALLVSRLPRIPAPTTSHGTVMEAVRAGLRHLLRTPDLRVLAVAMGAFNFAYNIAIATFVLYATRVLHVHSAAYGLLLAASAVGGIVAGWRAATLLRPFSYRQGMALVLTVQGLAWVGVALAPNAWTAGLALMVLGAAASLSSVIAGGARQALSPDELVGRVVAAFRIFGLGAAGLGALVGGFVATSWGLHAPLVLAASVLGLAAVATWLSSRS